MFPPQSTLLLLAALSAAGGGTLCAQYVWDGGHASQDRWSSHQNWNPNNNAPVNDGTANLVFAGTTRLTPDSDGDWNINSITFSSSAGAFILGGGTLTLQGTSVSAAILNEDLDTQTINHALVLGATQTWRTNAGNLVFGGNVTLGSYQLTMDGSGGILSSGVISGTGGLLKTGTGTLTLSGANTYTGGTTVSAGTLQGSSISLQGNITNNAALVFDQASGGNYAGVISGTGTLTKQGAGTLALSGANTYTGATTINAGTLSLGAAGVLADTTAVTVATGSTLALAAANETVGSIAGAGNITLSSYTLTSGGTNASTAFSGVISGTGGLVKTGTGTLTLSGANTYSGGTTVSAGTLQGSSTSLQGNITNNATLVFDQASGGTYAGVISGTGTLTKQGAGTLTISGANTYTGATTINAGTLSLGAAGVLADTTAVTVATGSTLALAAANESVGSIAGAGNITLSSYTLTSGGTNASTAFSGVITGTGGLVKTGTGTLTLSGANTYSGGTTVSAGTLQGSSTSLQGNITNNAALVFDQASGGTYAGVISGTGTLTKQGAGTLTLSGANTYSGATNLNAGTLAVGANNALSSASALTLAAGTTLSLGGSYSTLVGTLSYDNAILDYGTPGSANAFLFSSAGTGSGILTVNNWESGTDVLAFTAGNTPGSSFIENIYFSGIGSGTLGATGQTVAGYGGTWDFITANAGSFFTWDGGAANNNFNSAANWSTDVAPASGTSTKVAMAGNTRLTPNLNADYTLNSLKFDSTAGSFSLTANAGREFTFDGVVPSIIQASASAQTVNVPLILNKATFVETTGAGNLTLAGEISGTGGLNKLGTGGSLVLSGANTYTGTTTISEGTVVARNSAALGSTTGGTSVAAGAVLELQNNVSIGAESLSLAGTLRSNSGTNTYGGTVSGSGALSVGGGTLTLSGTAANTFTGGATINDGSLVLAKTAGINALAGPVTIGDGSGAASSAIVQLTNANQIADTAAVTLLADGRLNLNNQSDTIGSLATASSAANVQLGSATLTTGGDNSSTTFAGVIAGTGGLTKAGTGTFTLTGANTYTGATAINAGTVVAGHSTALGTTAGGTTVAAGAVLELQGNISIGTESLGLTGTLRSDSGTNTYAGAISGTGAVSVGGGSLTLSGTAANTFTGGAAVNAGTLTLAKTAGTDALAGPVTIGDGTGAASSAIVQLTNANQIADTAAVTLLADGRLNLNNQNEAIGSLAAASSAANVQLGSATLSTGGNNASTAFAGVITGTGGLTKTGTGTLTLSGANTYTGTTTVAGGTLALGASNALASTTDLTITSGGTLGLGGIYSSRVDSLSFSDGVIDYGTDGTPNYFLFSDDGTAAGTLTIQNWNSSADVLGVATNAIDQLFLDSTFFSGIGVGIGAELSTTTQAVGSYGNFYIIRPIETFTWDGGNTSGNLADQDNWSKGNNWAGNLAPATSAGKAIVMAGIVRTSNDMDAAYTIHSLLFSSDAGAFTISSSTGDTLTVRGGGLFNQSTATQTLSVPIALAANQTWNADSGNLVINGSSVLNSTYNLTVTGAQNTTVNAAIESGSGTITKAGTGTLTLAGTNTYTGATVINEGTVRVSNSSGLGSTAGGTSVAAGAVLELQGNASIGAEALALAGTLRSDSGTNTYAGAISGTGTVTVGGGGGSLTLAGTGANTFTGGASVNAGTLVLAKTAGTDALVGPVVIGDGTGAASSAIVQLTNANQIADTATVTLLSDGRLDLNGQNEAIGSLGSAAAAANIQLGAGTLTTGGSNASTTFAGVIAGSGGLTKAGTGTFTLSGANTYTGATTINYGTLLLGAGGVLADTTAVTVGAAGVLDVNHQTETVGSIAGAGSILIGTGQLVTGTDNTSTTFTGTLSGDSTAILAKNGTGTLTFGGDINAGPADFAGTINLNAGGLSIDLDNAFTGTVNVFAGATLRLSSATVEIANLNFVGSGTITLDFSGVSTLDVTNLTIAAGITVNVINWTDASDYFFAQNWSGAVQDIRGQSPMNQVVFASFAASDTQWQGYDNQVTPVPEPSTYGAMLIGAVAALLGWRRWRRGTPPAAARP